MGTVSRRDVLLAALLAVMFGGIIVLFVGGAWLAGAAFTVVWVIQALSFARRVFGWQPRRWLP